jgi:hypothetical protein
MRAAGSAGSTAFIKVFMVTPFDVLYRTRFHVS